MGRPLAGLALILQLPRVDGDVFPEGLASPREDWPMCLTLSLPADVARQLAADAH